MSVFLCSLFLLQPCLPHLIQHSCFAPSHIAVITSSKMPPTCRCSLQPVLPSLIQLLAPKQLCSIPTIKLAGSVGSHVLLSSYYFFPETVTRARQPFSYLPFTEMPSQTQFHYILPQNFFPCCHHTIVLPLSLAFSLFNPHKTTAIL